MKKEYDDIVAHAKPKWVEEGQKEEREDNIRKTMPVILQLGGTIQDVANIFGTTPEEIQKILDAENEQPQTKNKKNIKNEAIIIF